MICTVTLTQSKPLHSFSRTKQNACTNKQVKETQRIQKHTKHKAGHSVTQQRLCADVTAIARDNTDNHDYKRQDNNDNNNHSDESDSSPSSSSTSSCPPSSSSYVDTPPADAVLVQQRRRQGDDEIKTKLKTLKLKTRHKRHEQTPTRLKGLDPPPLTGLSPKAQREEKQNNTRQQENCTTQAASARTCRPAKTTQPQAARSSRSRGAARCLVRRSLLFFEPSTFFSASLFSATNCWTHRKPTAIWRAFPRPLLLLRLIAAVASLLNSTDTVKLRSASNA